MKPKKPASDPERRAQLQAELRRDRAAKETGYRERALRIHPHICARCAREFEGRRLRELTVHHIDHNYKNNPPDGSNWQLLCIYCHDDEHEKYVHKGRHAGSPSVEDQLSPSIFSPFEGLDALVKPETDEETPTKE